MNNNNETLSVLFASNNLFSPYLGVSIYSLLKNNQKFFEKINIYIFDDEISEENKEKLILIGKKFNQELNFIDLIDIEKVVGTSINVMEKEGIISLTAYARLFSSTVVYNLDKILYLDADSIITGSFKELWEKNIEEYYVAGVLDTLGVDFIKKQINLNENHKYINSGVLLINLKKWREDKLEEKFINFLINHLDRFIFHDQGIINGVCKDKILYVSPKYNLQGQFHGIDYKKATKWAGFPDYYDEETVKEAQENPVFIHFTGALNRPWSNQNQEYYGLYYDYANETPFNEDVKFKDVLSKKSLIFYSIYKSSLMTVLLKILPMSIAIKMANKRIKKICDNETELNKK